MLAKLWGVGCVFRESMAAPWAACDEVRQGCRRRNSEEASLTPGETWSRTSASSAAVFPQTLTVLLGIA